MYDVVIIGGGTSGCACAYTAGKLGLKTLLIEKSIQLGGTITSGLVIPVMFSGKNQINTDFFNDFVNYMKNFDGQINYDGNNGWFNPEIAKIVLDKMLTDAGVEMRFNTSVHKAEVSKNKIEKIYVNKKILSERIDKIYTNNNSHGLDETLFEPIAAKYYIDATGNCEFGKLIGCEFINKSDEIQPVTMRFIMSGVDTNVFAKWIIEFDNDRDVTTCEVVDGTVHFSTAYTWDKCRKWALSEIFDRAVDDGVLKDADRNYFQIFTVAGAKGAVAFNCPRMIDNIDFDSVLDVTNTVKEARAMIYRIAKFSNIYLPGFKDAYISNIANFLGVRVSNRIKGKYIYTYEDLISGKKFKNPVLISNYPVDIHRTDKSSEELKTMSEYQLPIESLMSNDFDNLFVAGRCISADFKAQSALRVQSSCFSMGEAVAKYIKKTPN